MQNQGGFFQLIVIFILIVVILSLLGVSLSNLIGNPVMRDNFSFLWKWTVWLWNGLLEKPAKFAARTFIDFIWEPLVKVMRDVKGGATPKLDE